MFLVGWIYNPGALLGWKLPSLLVPVNFGSREREKGREREGLGIAAGDHFEEARAKHY